VVTPYVDILLLILELLALIVYNSFTRCQDFNEYVGNATGLAVYGCGIIAAAHVGGIRALEKHGLRYNKIKTLAGVSSGSVVVAMLAVGYDADGLFK